ncbi:hypothetical protein PQX77_009490 [Marasmius sp. AFHP31]|nr:hypothetical protein PQX77_009490 [Marasmius sp. AFHP31]
MAPSAHSYLAGHRFSPNGHYHNHERETRNPQPFLKDHSDANVDETEREAEPGCDDDGLLCIGSSQSSFTLSQSATIPSGDNGDNEEHPGAEEDDQDTVSEPPLVSSSQPQSDVHRCVFCGRHRATSPPPQKNNTPTPMPASSQQREPAEPSSSQPSMSNSSQDVVFELGVGNGVHLPTGSLRDSQSN